jgi:hypothetical protein
MNKREFFREYERIPIALTEVKRRKMYGMVDKENKIYYPQVIATNDGEVLYGRDPIRIWCKDFAENDGFIELFPSSSSTTISSEGYTIHEFKPAKTKSPRKTKSKTSAKSKKGGFRKSHKVSRR